MYKFTNGLVCFTEEDKENYIKAGLVLLEEKEKVVEKDNRNESFTGEHKASSQNGGRISKRTNQRNK